MSGVWCGPRAVLSGGGEVWRRGQLGEGGGEGEQSDGADTGQLGPGHQQHSTHHGGVLRLLVRTYMGEGW